MPDASASPSRSLLAMANKFEQCRQQRDYYDAYDDQSKVVFYQRNVAKQEACQRKAGNPGYTAKRAEQHEQPITHQTDAGDKRGEGANDGQKAGEYDGLTAVLFVECMRLVEMLALDQLGVGSTEQTHSDQPAYPVVGVITTKGSQNQQWRQQFQLQRAHPAQRAGHEQQ